LPPLPLLPRDCGRNRPTAGNRKTTQKGQAAKGVETMSNDRRWVAATHEAGHALCFFAYAGRPTIAAISPDGSGYAMASDLRSTARAIAIATGRSAEALAELIDPPAMSDVGMIRLWLDEDRLERKRATPPPPTPTAAPRELRDEVQLGYHAVEADPFHPEKWAGYVARARQRADDFVRDNAGAIIALARRLYDQGQIGPQDFAVLGLISETTPAHVASAPPAGSPAQSPLLRQKRG
jgi:hypothetical protein